MQKGTRNNIRQQGEREDATRPTRAFNSPMNFYPSLPLQQYQTEFKAGDYSLGLTIIFRRHCDVLKICEVHVGMFIQRDSRKVK